MRYAQWHMHNSAYYHHMMLCYFDWKTPLKISAYAPEDLTRVCRRYNVKTVFKCLPTLRQQLCRIKDRDPIERSAGVVYEILYACGQT